VTKGKLSDRQKRMLDFIQRFTADNGYPPSIREIGDAADISIDFGGQLQPEPPGR
jgi:repressor LexA